MAARDLHDSIAVPVPSGPINARVTLPGSKSYTNRALPIAALGRGESTLRGTLDSEDTRYMTEALRRLDIDIEADWERNTMRVVGVDGNLPANRADLFLGNSGTSVRFLTALVALGNGTYRLDGTPRMRQRPLAPLIDGLASIGVDVRSEAGTGCPPLVIKAAGLPGGTVRMRGDVSSQYFSAVAMVLPYARDQLTIEVDGDLVSKPYLDMTADTMRAFGVDLHHDGYRRFWIEPGHRYAGRDYRIEPDASAASYFFALAAVTGGTITVENLPPSSAQGDLRFVDVLEQMGCRVVRGPHDVTVTGPDQLLGVDVDMNAISDTVQTLAAIAPFAATPVAIRNVRHIRFKETDRLAAVTTELRRMGVEVVENDDSLLISSGHPHATTVETYDDHRMAMSFAVAGTRIPGLRIANPACVAKTVPGFWDLLFPLLGASPPSRSDSSG